MSSIWFLYYLQRAFSTKRDTTNKIEEGKYRGADKSLARPGRKQATATEDFDVHISYL
jgi:hypothetical protein